MFYPSENSLYCFLRKDGMWGVEETRRVEMDRGAAMLAVVLDVYEGGKDLIPGWKLKEHAENALANRWRRRAQAVLRGVPD
jgi:hypothetical protein